MEETYNKWQLIDLDLKKIEPVIFTKEELLHFANYYHTEQLRLGVVSSSKTLETKLINKRDKLKKDRLQIQNLINNNNSMSYDYIYDKARMIPFLNSQIDLINTLLND